MWKYIAAAFLIAMGAIELLLALNSRLRDEIMKNSPIPTRVTPTFLLMAAASAFFMALVLVFYNRIF